VSPPTLFGAIAYTYTQETLTAADVQVNAAAGGAVQFTTVSGQSSFPAPQLSGEIYKVEYSWTSGASSWTGASDNNRSPYSTFTLTVKAVGSAGSVYDSKSSVYPDSTLWYTPFGLAQTSHAHTVTGSNLSVDAGALWAQAYAESEYYTPTWPSGGAWSSASLTVTLSNLQATVYHRTPVSNSTTPANTFILNSHSYTLTAAQVLAVGSLNWLAVGM